MLKIINGILWSPATLLLIIITAITIGTKNSFRAIKKPLKTLKCTIFSKSFNKSSFEAMCTALGGTIGVGNTVGVASAIAEGGSGAQLWMLIASFFGMIIKEAEIYLSLKYKPLNSQFSGPMFYIEQGIGNKLFAKFWAISCVLTSFGMGNVSQSMTAVKSIEQITSISRTIISVIIAVIVLMSVSLGISRIKKCLGVFIPFVTIIFLSMSAIIFVIQIDNLPKIFNSNATSVMNLKNGLIGIKWSLFIRSARIGFSRGIFTNESGLGSACIVHSTSEERSPEAQARWGVTEVFIDTVIICMLTGIIILTSGISASPETITQTIFITRLGDIGGIVYAFSMLIFALASIIAWYCYAECSLKYLGVKTTCFKYIFPVITFIGGITKAYNVLIVSDIFNAIMLITNLCAMLLLSNQAKSN